MGLDANIYLYPIKESDLVKIDGVECRCHKYRFGMGEDMIYWRKNFFVHAWIVEYCLECICSEGDTIITKEEMEQLINVLRTGEFKPKTVNSLRWYDQHREYNKSLECVNSLQMIMNNTDFDKEILVYSLSH